MKLYQLGELTLRLNIWDIAGQDTAGSLSKLFCRQAAGAIVTFDVTDKDTLESAVKWKEKLDEICPTKFPVILAANKYDLIKEYGEDNSEIKELCPEFETESYKTSAKDILDDFANRHGFIGCIRTSAKDDYNVDLIFKSLVESVIEANMTTNEENGEPELDINNLGGRYNNSVLLSYGQSIAEQPKNSSIISQKSK